MASSQPSPPSSFTDKVQAYAAVVGIIVTIVGFIFLIVEIKHTKLALEISESSLTAATHERLLLHNLEMHKIMLAHPEIRSYYYEGKKLETKKEPEDQTYNLVNTTSEAFADFFEHVSFQLDTMDESHRRAWKKYGMNIFCDSFVLRKFMKENEDWYHGKVKDMIGFKPTWPDQDP